MVLPLALFIFGHRARTNQKGKQRPCSKRTYTPPQKSLYPLNVKINVKVWLKKPAEITVWCGISVSFYTFLYLINRKDRFDWVLASCIWLRLSISLWNCKNSSLRIVIHGGPRFFLLCVKSHNLHIPWICKFNLLYRNLINTHA